MRFEEARALTGRICTIFSPKEPDTKFYYFLHTKDELWLGARAHPLIHARINEPDGGWPRARRLARGQPDG